MYNCITLIGNLGADPEIKNTSAGKKFAILSLATNRTVASEKQTDWHKVVVWDDKIADILQRYTKKGERVLLEGRLTYRKYQTESGEEKEKAEEKSRPTLYLTSAQTLRPRLRLGIDVTVIRHDDDKETKQRALGRSLLSFTEQTKWQTMFHIEFGIRFVE